MHTFTSKMQAPNGDQVVTASLDFPDGTRSVAAVYHGVLTLGAGKGARLVSADVGAFGRTAAGMDALMAAGYVVLYLPHPGRNPATGKAWPAGFWAWPARIASPRDTEAFTWGMNQLSKQAVHGAVAEGVVSPDGSAGGPPTDIALAPSGGGGPMRITPPALPPLPPPMVIMPWWRHDAVMATAGVLVLGGLAWFMVES